MIAPGSAKPVPQGRIRALKRFARNWLTRLRNRYVNRFMAFDNERLEALLRRLGLTEGDTVFAHVAYNRFLGFQGGPGDVIEVLQKIVGPSGTILMPTLPFRRTAVEYAENNPLTDLGRAPSAMGFVTEIFRRMPGVVRSAHPTHPVAAWGARARELTQDHHQSETPCGKHSPFLRLPEVRGKILFLGAGINTMTFYHGVEEVIEPHMPTSPFTTSWYELQTRDSEGVVRTTRTRLFDPAMSKRRDMRLLLPELRRSRVWFEGRLGQLSVSLVGAAETLNVCEQMAARGEFVYRQ